MFAAPMVGMRRMQSREARGKSEGGQYVARFRDEASIALSEPPWGHSFRQPELERLSESPAVHDRVVAASSQSIDPSVIDYLAFDEAAAVRMAAARNPKLAWHLVLRLTDDPDPAVRRAVVESSRLGVAELNKMLRDDDDTVVDTIVESVVKRGMGRVVVASTAQLE